MLKSKATPEQINKVAVTGFIATNPGTTRFNPSIPNAHPTRTIDPMKIASALAIIGSLPRSAGSLTGSGVSRDCEVGTLMERRQASRSFANPAQAKMKSGDARDGELRTYAPYAEMPGDNMGAALLDSTLDQERNR